jgi:hypothetical protein
MSMVKRGMTHEGDSSGRCIGNEFLSEEAREREAQDLNPLKDADLIILLTL